MNSSWKAICCTISASIDNVVDVGIDRSDSTDCGQFPLAVLVVVAEAVLVGIRNKSFPVGPMHFAIRNCIQLGIFGI